MNITKHARQRWTERIIGISNTNDRNIYISKNTDQIDKNIQKTFDYSELVYTGQVGDKTVKKFYLHQDICMVVSTDDNIITVYRINFAFPEQTKLNVINDLKKVIMESSEEILRDKAVVDRKNEIILLEIDTLKAERKALEEKIELLAIKIISKEGEKALNLKELAIKNTNNRIYAESLFGNTDLKADLA